MKQTSAANALKNRYKKHKNNDYSKLEKYYVCVTVQYQKRLSGRIDPLTILWTNLFGRRRAHDNLLLGRTKSCLCEPPQ